MAERSKIYFISDIHLGAPALHNNKERERLFVRWLDEVSKDAAEIFLMGDIFDFWFEYAHVVPRGFTRVLGKIGECTDKGIPIHYFTGNHDIWIFDYLPSETGVILHKEAFRAEFGGKKFFLAHGDGMDPNDKGYLFIKKIFTNKTMQWLFALLHPDCAIKLAHAWSKSSRMAKNTKGPEFDFQKEGIYKFALTVLEKEEVDYFVFGHRHRIADISIGIDSRLILLGEWIESFSYGVFDGEKFMLKYYVNT